MIGINDLVIRLRLTWKKNKETFRNKVLKKSNLKPRLRLFTVISMLLKTLIFLSLIYYVDADNLSCTYVDHALMLAHIAFVVLFVSPVFLFNNKGSRRYLIGLNFIFSIFLVLDLWYYRCAGGFLELRELLHPQLVNPLNRSFINLKWQDLLFVIDLPLMFIKNIKPYKRSIGAFVSTFLLSLVIIFGTYYLIDIRDVTKGDEDFLKYVWSPKVTMQDMSPIGYHLFEIYDTSVKALTPVKKDEVKQIDQWLKDNREDIPDNEYRGIFKGKNVIGIQVESLENFVIGQSVCGEEITPNLNKLVGKSYYFTNIREQNNKGNSIDCDMLVNTSVLPLGDSITFLTNPQVNYNSIQKVLKKEGYYSITSHAEIPQAWNWSEVHKGMLGADKVIDRSEYVVDEEVGYGISDKRFYEQYLEKLKTFKQPFYSTTPTLSSHAPFDLKPAYRYLNLPKDLDDNMLGSYFQAINYMDRQLGIYLDALDKAGFLDNSVIVIYGDHTSVHKYYNNKIQNADLAGDWWKKDDKNIPFIIYSKNMKPQKFDTEGGQVDFMPTLCYLLGVKDDLYRNTVMGRILVRKSKYKARKATITKGNVIYGQPVDDKEKQHLLKAYDIGRMIVENNYFNK